MKTIKGNKIMAKEIVVCSSGLRNYQKGLSGTKIGILAKKKDKFKKITQFVSLTSCVS